MEALPSTVLRPFFQAKPPRSPRPDPAFVGRRRRLSVAVPATHGGEFGRRSVDEDMIVLRMRIRDMEIAEMKGDDVLPRDWMGWEREYYEKYNSDVCQAVAALQSFFLSSRPSVALGLLAVVALSVPVTGVFLFSKIVEVANVLMIPSVVRLS